MEEHSKRLQEACPEIDEATLKDHRERTWKNLFHNGRETPKGMSHKLIACTRVYFWGGGVRRSFLPHCPPLPGLIWPVLTIGFSIIICEIAPPWVCTCTCPLLKVATTPLPPLERNPEINPACAVHGVAVVVVLSFLACTLHDLSVYL